MKLLNLEFEATERQWSNREFVAATIEETALLNERAIGSQKALMQIITWLENLNEPGRNETSPLPE